MAGVRQGSTAKTTGVPAAGHVIYSLQGTLLEACSCKVLCPCWIGEDPDTGTCDAVVAYHFDRGAINGIDVSGLNMVGVAKIPGNILTPKSWKLLVLVDERASDEQLSAIVDAYSGKFGGPLADMAQLIGEVLAVERAPISHEVRGGAGTLKVGDAISAEMEPYRSRDGDITTLRDSIFSNIPGSPAYVSKATHHTVNLPKYGMVWSFEGRNAIQGDYSITYTGQ
ncbi:DUF1326 domain-containing protein [bacterium]|nr:MAG: DUF1326 domain-containing protein [bacterium]